MKHTILLFSGIAVVIVLLFQLQQWALFSSGGSDIWYVIVSGMAFLLLGIFISRYFFVTSEKRKRQARRSSLSKQELRVLELMADGRSNKEISEQLYIAETTVKSHVSNVLSKLEAKRRTEAVKVARDLDII